MAAFIPLIAAVVGTAGSMYAQSESQKAQESAAEESRAYAQYQQDKLIAQQKEQAAANEKAWKENAFPNSTELAAKQAETAASLGSERTKRLDQLSRTASLRGWGPGSGALSQAASTIEGDYLSALGKASTNLTEYANTPRFSYPFSTGSVGYAPSYSSPNSGYSTGWSNPLASAMGMYLYKNMGGNNNASGYNYVDVPQSEYYSNAYDVSGW